MQQETNDYVLTEQFNALRMQAPVSNLTIVAISLLFYFILQPYVSQSLLMGWVSVMWLAASIRFYLWYSVRQQPETANHKNWVRNYSIACFFVGVAWSLVYLFLITSDELVVYVALFMLIFGVLSSSVSILSPYLPAFVAYSFPQILVLASVMSNQGGISMYILTLSILMYMLMLTLFARNANRQFITQVKLSHENSELVEKLNQEVSDRESVIADRMAELSLINSALKKEIDFRKQLEGDQQVQYGLLRSVIDSTPDLIFYKDYRNEDGCYLGCNEAFSGFTGKTIHQIIGKNDIQLFGEKTGQFFRKKDLEMLDANETRLNEEWVTYPDGSKVLLSTLKTPFYDSKNQVLGVLGVSRDITEQNKIEEQLRQQEKSLRHMAHHDPLTNLPNRLLMIDRLQQSIERVGRTGNEIAVLFIDLDHFKEVNDSLGHTLGDKLLKAVAKRLKNSVRGEDTVARLGGDEFTVIFELTQDNNAADWLAEKIIEAFNTPFHIDEHELSVTTSIGISLYPQDAQNTEQLLQNADTAMYQAKAEGRNAYRYYSSDMTERARQKLAIEAELRVAINEKQFEIYYQPQIDLANGQTVAVEALLRWHHPRKGLLLPDLFIDVAEETGLINPIGDWVLEQACKTLKAWEKNDGPSIPIAVNLSGRQISNLKLADHVSEMVSHSGCNANKLELEITEGFLINHPEQSKDMLDILRSKGISIAIDDFGTGYSSLSYLKQFPITKIKIDYSFVRDIATDSNDKAIAAAVIALGNSLELSVIAEGVETQEQVNFLKSHDCHLAQGFLYARPMSENDLFDYLIENNQVVHEHAVS